jgi:hypothetical protein
MFPLRPLFAIITLTLPAVSCRKAEVTSYRVPKETTPAPTVAAATTPAPPAGTGPGMANPPATPTASGTALTWTAPAHWKAQPASAMRKASYAIPGDGGATGDLSISSLSGNAGGELPNLNRWRGQLQLPPIAEADFATATTHLDSNDLHLTFVDIVGTGANAQRILGAMIPNGRETWFFKLTGPDALLAKEKPAFLEFLKTIKAGTAPSPAAP